MSKSSIVPNDTSDRLQALLLQEFNTDEQQQFVMHFYLYMKYQDDDTRYEISLDDIWEWLGFSRRDNAKRLIMKEFKIDVDYVLSKPLLPKEERSNGGQNKDVVMMNVSTFKDMCMKANTEKGKQTRAYYRKMETIFLKYNKEQQTQLIGNMEATFECQLEMERHRALIKAYDKMPLVYILKVKCPHIKGEHILIKLGYSDDVADRILKLSSMFGCPVIVMHLYPCENNKAFEQFLFKHHKIAPLKHNELIGENKAKSTECFLMKSEFMLNMVRRILDKHVLFYKTKNQRSKELDIQIKNVENERLRLQQNALLINMFHNNPDGLLRALELTSQDKSETVENNQATFEEEKVVMANGNEDSRNGEPITAQRIYGPQVQLYDGTDTSRLLQVFKGITDATREISNASFTAIKNAAKTRQIYLGHRWFLIDKNDPEPNKPRDIGATITSRQRYVGFVAMMDLDRSRVLNVFSTQREASEHLSQHDSAMSSAIKYGTPLSGFFWIHWHHVDAEKQEIYLRTHKLPVVETKARGVPVMQIDPETLKVIATHPSITDVVKKFNMSPKTIKRIVLQETTYKGFQWKLGDVLSTSNV